MYVKHNIHGSPGRRRFGRGGYMTPSSSFTMGQQYPPHQVSPTSVTDTSYLYSQAPPPLSSNHRSTKSPSKSRQPRGSTIKLGGHGSGEEQLTPQNLRDSPERLAKVKTEMCTYFLKGGSSCCPYGKNCNYAHGKHELKNKHTSLHLMESSGQIACASTYLSRPCMTWVATGACPFGRRCAAIHDPMVAGLESNPSWLPAATSKTNARVIIDRFTLHNDNIVHQENPLIQQSIWEHCRPSQKGIITSFTSGQVDVEQVWLDTYRICSNSGTSAFNVKKMMSEKISELQKLCIVRKLRSGDSGMLSRDYLFSPTHSLNSELCMILQERYFLLPDVNYTSAGDVSVTDCVKEISADEYEARTTPWTIGHSFDPTKVVTAHEVAFAPKGDHSANVSIWFDAEPIKLEPSQIKRSRRLKQKKKSAAKHTAPNANGDLISRTTNTDFPSGYPEIDPFVCMLPAKNDDESHGLIMSIIEHRINCIIIEDCSSFVTEEQIAMVYAGLNKLKESFVSLFKFHEKNMWPKREGMTQINRSTMAPPSNTMPYIGSDKTSPCIHNWKSFVETIGLMNASTDAMPTSDADSRRLDTFKSFCKSSGKSTLPRIKAWWAYDASYDTWREVVLKLPENGNWQAAIRLHEKKKALNSTTTGARDTPLSTIHFVQNETVNSKKV